MLPDATALGTCAALVFVAFGCAWLFARATVARTPRLRDAVKAWIGLRRPDPHAGDQLSESSELSSSSPSSL